MALKSFINDSENNQAGDFDTLHTALISRAGVFDLPGGDLLVTGTAGKTVNIGSGGGFVENSSYVNGTQDQKFFPFASNATESVTIDDNTSGNPRIDLICAKIDTAVSPGTRGINSISFVAVKGTPGVSPARPSLPSNHLELSELNVPNGFTSTSGNLTDTRVQYKIFNYNDGWDYIDLAPTYQSASVIRFSSIDLTDIFSIGDGIAFTQPTDGQKYFYVVGVALNSGNTDLTIEAGTTYDLDNESITNFKFSKNTNNANGFPEFFGTTLSGFTGSGSMTYTGVTQSLAKFKVEGGLVKLFVNVSGTTGGSASNTIRFEFEEFKNLSGATITTGTGLIEGLFTNGLVYMANGDNTIQVRKSDSSNFSLTTVTLILQIDIPYIA